MTYKFRIQTPIGTPLTIGLDTHQWGEAASPAYHTENSFAFLLFYAWLGTAINERGIFLNQDRFSPKDLYEALSLDWKHGFDMDGEIPASDHQSLPMAEQWEYA